jgi:CTP:molybdopterin cytidylyltransferase MocA
VILAAGGGTRFAGRPHKLLVPFRGRPLVAWAVEAALGAALDETALVVGAVELPAFGGVVVVRNERWREGQATSLAAAVRWATDRGHEAIVVGLADQPLVPSEAWRRVAACAAAPIAVATYAGVRRNPVRLAASVWPLLPRRGDVGARALMAEHPELVVEVACPGDPADIDTVEDLEAWS